MNLYHFKFFLKNKAAFLFFVLACNAAQAQQNTPLLKLIDKTAGQVEALIKLSQTRIELSTVASQKFDPEDKSNFQQLSLTENIDRNKLQRYFDSLYIKTALVYPYNMITISTESSRLLQLLGKDNFYFMENPDKKPVVRPLRAAYLDGTEEAVQDKYVSIPYIREKYKKTIKENGETYEIVEIDSAARLENEMWEEQSSFYDYITIKNAKPVKSLSVAIELPIQATTVSYAAKSGDGIVTDIGTIKLLALSGNDAVLQIPSAIEGNVAIYGLYKDGRMLNQKSSSSFTVVSDEKIAAYETFLQTLKDAKTLVEKGKIKNESELEKYLQENTPAAIANADDHDDAPSQINYIQKKITFAGPADKIAIVRTLPQTEAVTIQSTYHINYDEDNKEYLVASDFETSKNGILSKSGKWLIQPQYDEHFRMMNRYYFTDQIEDRENNYHYNPQTNKLTKTAYKLDDREIYLDKYVKIEPHINGPKGIANALTGEVLLPMQYQFVHLHGDKFWIAENSADMDGAFDLNFKELLPFRFSSIRFEDGFFYARFNEDSDEDVYNEAGKNITNGKYVDIDGEFSSGRLLVQSAKEERPGYLTGSRYYFLDKQGNAVIDLQSKGFSDAEMFRSGLAVVKDAKTGLYGFIGPNGKLVLPCVYNSVSFGFFEASEYAPVQLSNGDYCLIDKQGRVKKKFDASFDVVNYRGSNSNLYVRVNGVWYDAFGERVRN